MQQKKPKTRRRMTADEAREHQADNPVDIDAPYSPPPFINPYGGRPPKEINIELVKQLCAIQATDSEIAACCGVSRDTILRRKNSDPVFAQIMDDARQTGKASVRRTLYMQAVRGDVPAFSMFWAKNHLGMSDKPEETGPIPVEQARRIKDALDAIEGAVIQDDPEE